MWLLLISASNVQGQETVIKGNVSDALTGEPIPFVNVAFKNTSIGAVSDIDGNYSINTSVPSDSLMFSFIGYIPVTMAVNKGQAQTINVVLKVSSQQLEAVQIIAGENPADVMMKKVVENKDNHNPEKHSSLTYESYNKLELDLTKISEKFKNSKIVRPFAFIFDKIDSTSTNEDPFLPFFITETVSDIYYTTNPKRKKEIIKASKVSGLENETVTQFLGDMYQQINVYDNYLNIFEKSFISPAASFGNVFYEYYLVDSSYIESAWCYKLKFKPKRKQELTFNGYLWIHDTTFAVRKVEMRVATDANLNFVNEMGVVQEFAPVKNADWVLKKDILVVEFAPTKEGMGFIGRKTTSYKNVKVNEPINEEIFSGTENVIIEDNALYQDTEYWQDARHEKLNEREEQIYTMIDTIKTLPAFRTWVDIVTLVLTGYYEVGPVELGPYFSLYSFNTVEGNRFRFGARTGNKFSTRVILDGYLAYGTKDEKYKYKGGIRYFLHKKPRQFIGASYKDDVSQLGQSDNAFQDDNILSSVFRRNDADKLTRLEESNVYYEREWFQGLSNKISLTNSRYTPLGTLATDSLYTYYTDDSKTEIKNTINTTEISLLTRFAYREKFVSGKVDRISLGSKYPVVQVNYVLGLKDVLDSDLQYQKVAIKVTDKFKINPIGYTYIIGSAGKVWGEVPFPMLEVHQGNESFFYDYASFNLMNYYEFVSDEYISLFATHHFEGFFFDKIPAFRKLKWRELAAIKLVSGSLSEKNKEIQYDPQTVNTSDSFNSLAKPYVETNLGVENIFKLIRIDFVWRLSYLDKDNVSPFGVRASFNITF
ncbi:MAG: carboxypeptidase-like regulatory domain-containing protein [Bacteroidia bacterium]|nr:carboxypeptidase-like regulatory domain-containing protein [Bacteroidia bacterium]